MSASLKNYEVRIVPCPEASIDAVYLTKLLRKLAAAVLEKPASPAAASYSFLIRLAPEYISALFDLVKRDPNIAGLFLDEARAPEEESPEPERPVYRIAAPPETELRGRRNAYRADFPLKHIIPPAKKPAPRRKEIFVSYSHKDTRWFDIVQTHLAPLVSYCAINIWSDKMILPGDKWPDEIKQAIQRASVAVLLLSPNYIASPFINNEELPPILKKYSKKGLNIFWLLLSPCLYEELPLANIQAAFPLVKDRSLKDMKTAERDRTLVDVVRKIKTCLD